MRLIGRSVDKKGQLLLESEIEIEGWWSSLTISEEEIIQLYCDHGTSEQFHSEFKTDLDIEHLPSGKFATNALILRTSMLAYNILRWIGPELFTWSSFSQEKQSKKTANKNGHARVNVCCYTYC
jgi:hypothetical protein